MRPITNLASILTLSVGLGVAGIANADEFADSPESLVTFGDVTGDDGDGGADATDAPNGDVNDNTTFTSLGWDGTDGGTLVLNFDDNLCFDDGSAANDFMVYEVGAGEGGQDEPYIVNIGLQGAALAALAATGNGDTAFDTEGVAWFNQISLTATGSFTSNTTGADIDAVECDSTLDQADITKAFAASANADGNDTGNDDDIFIGIDEEQHKAFAIRIENSTGIDDAFDGLTFMDTVPAEFDIASLSVDNASEASDAGECSAGFVEHTSQGKNGFEQLKPDFISIDAGGLAAGEACTVTVEVVTDLKKGGNRPGRGNSPVYTPTSCPTGGVVLNDGVRVIDDSTGATVLSDDDTLALSCAF